MTAKILGSSGTFSGVSYNTNKVDSQKGELMDIANFGPLQGIPDLRPEDYRNYLKMVSAKSKRTKNPQFHAVISCKGSEFDKFQLTEIAKKWLEEMGYANQPYMIVFHNDTENNHVHMVSTRVDQFTGIKLPESYEKIKAVERINKIMNLESSAIKDIDKALSYRFQTQAQFFMILESMGYNVNRNSNFLEVIKYGRIQETLDKNILNDRLKMNDIDQKRMHQVRAIVSKYKSVFSSALTPIYEPLPNNRNGKIKGYSSPLTDFIKSKFGIDFQFHFKDDKAPYGYSVLDHAKGNVFKGSDILKLRELTTHSHKPTKDWLMAVLNTAKVDKLGAVDFDRILLDNALKRKDLVIMNSVDSIILTLDKNDLDELHINDLQDNIYTVSSIGEQNGLSDLLGVSSDNIKIDDQMNSKYYRDLLNAVVRNFATIKEGLKTLNFSILNINNDAYLLDDQNNNLIKIDKIADQNTVDLITNLELEIDDNKNMVDLSTSFLHVVDIADDIDDEAIHGRNRRRKKHSRTNSR